MPEPCRESARNPARDDFDYSRLYERLKKLVLKELHGLGIGGSAVNLEALVSVTEIRNTLIRHAYRLQLGRGVKAEALYWELGSKYYLSWKTVKYIVHNCPAQVMTDADTLLIHPD